MSKNTDEIIASIVTELGRLTTELERLRQHNKQLHENPPLPPRPEAVMITRALGSGNVTGCFIFAQRDQAEEILAHLVSEGIVGKGDIITVDRWYRGDNWRITTSEIEDITAARLPS